MALFVIQQDELGNDATLVASCVITDALKMAGDLSSARSGCQTGGGRGKVNAVRLDRDNGKIRSIHRELIGDPGGADISTSN